MSKKITLWLPPKEIGLEQQVRELSRYRSSFSSSRLEFRTLLLEDVNQNYVNWLNDPIVNQFLESRHKIHTIESVMEFVDSVDRSSTSVFFGVFLADNGRHVGNVKLSEINLVEGSAEIGYLIGEMEVWGQGYATEAVSEVCLAALRDLGIATVTAGAYSKNMASIAVLRKCGFSDVPSETEQSLRFRKAQDKFIGS
jgi:RimJ/RimL family protein N-acetyltransferase